MITKLLFLSVIFGLMCLEIKAQVHYYDIYRDGNKPIGTIQTTRIKNGNITYIKADTHVSFRLLFKVNLVYLFHVKFINGLFSKSNTKNTANGKVREYSKINWDGVKYKTEVNHKTKDVYLTQAQYTTLSMYYEEPVNKTKVFSERYAKYCKLRALGRQVYELTLPNGNKNHYKYRNGKCVEVTVNTTLATLKFKLRP